MDFNGTVREATVTISRNAEGVLTGVWADQLGDTALETVAFVEGVLSFVRKLSFNDQSFELPFEGRLDGDKLVGNFVTQFGEMPVTGTRAPSAAGGASGATAMVGTWNITSSTLTGEAEWRLVVGEDLTGVCHNGDLAMPVSGMKVEGESLTFKVAVTADGAQYELTFNGTMGEAGFAGRFSLPGLGAIAEVSAVAAPGAAAGPATDMSVLVGSWQLSSRSDMGQQQSTLTINSDFTGSMSVGEMSMPLDYVDLQGDELSFGIAVNMGGANSYIEFWGKLTGGTFNGAIWAQGQEVATIKGTKKLRPAPAQR
jgi:hypothetical protein